MYGEESPSAPERDGPAVKSPWRGGGGRWTVWPLRVVLWVAIIVIGYRGVMAIVLNETPTSTSSAPAPAAPAPSSKFPVTLAEAYALQFGQVYLNFNPVTAAQRAHQLASFIPSSASEQQSQFGWNGSGSAKLSSEQVAGIDVRGPNTAVVTLLATVNDKLMELGVPVYSSGGTSLVVSGQPAWLPAPSAAQPPSSQTPNSDQGAQSALMSQLPAFFSAYASGDQSTLNRYLASGASINGLNGAVRFGSIGNITVPQGGDKRDITVTVNWLLPGQPKQSVPQLTTTYDMSVVDQQSGKWYVEDIRASTQPMGTQ
ncbi:MAG: conjugal transfer protein [Streptosporangiales bacterium]|nr:conjugal transfer protein [Streptosporangiales bacterium]